MDEEVGKDRSEDGWMWLKTEQEDDGGGRKGQDRR
jgi:hypothetical protein